MVRSKLSKPEKGERKVKSKRDWGGKGTVDHEVTSMPLKVSGF
jgi:hypothetical protein